MHEKRGYESPSTVSVTSFSSDTDLLPPPPLHNHDDSSSSEHSYVVSLHYHYHASVIQAAARRLLACKQVPSSESSSKWAKQRENDKNRAATKIQAILRSRRVRMISVVDKMMEKRWERTQRSTVPLSWAKQRENEKKRCNAAATTIQAAFRSWRAHMMLLIDRMEKRLERTQRRTECALQWAEQLKQSDMEQIRRSMVTDTEIDQHLVERDLERDLSETLQIFEELRAKNKKLRMSNQNLMMTNETHRKKNRELHAENMSFNKEIALVSARLPRLKGENKTLVESDNDLEKRTSEYQNSVQEVKDFWELEMKTAAATKEVIIKILSVLKESSGKDEVARTITEVGMAKLERNEEHAKYLLKEARQKIAKDEAKERRYGKPHLSSASGSSESKSDKVPPPKRKLLKTASKKSLVKSEPSASEDNPDKSTAQVPMKKSLGPVNTKTSAPTVQKNNSSTVPMKSSLDGVKRIPGEKRLGPAENEGRVQTTQKENAVTSHPGRRTNPLIKPTSSRVAGSVPVKKRLPDCASGRVRANVSVIVTASPMDRNLPKKSPQNGQGQSKESYTETHSKSSTMKRAIRHKSPFPRLAPLRVKRAESSERPTKILFTKRREQGAENSGYILGKEPATRTKKSIKVAHV